MSNENAFDNVLNKLNALASRLNTVLTTAKTIHSKLFKIASILSYYGIHLNLSYEKITIFDFQKGRFIQGDFIILYEKKRLYYTIATDFFNFETFSVRANDYPSNTFLYALYIVQQQLISDLINIVNELLSQFTIQPTTTNNTAKLDMIADVLSKL